MGIKVALKRDEELKSLSSEHFTLQPISAQTFHLCIIEKMKRCSQEVTFQTSKALLTSGSVLEAFSSTASS